MMNESYLNDFWRAEINMARFYTLQTAIMTRRHVQLFAVGNLGERALEKADEAKFQGILN